MMKCNNESALEIAIELVKINIESTEEWVSPDMAKYFIEEVYTFLTEGKSDNE